MNRRRIRLRQTSSVPGSVKDLCYGIFILSTCTRNIEAIRLLTWRVSNYKSEREQLHEDDPGKVPRGNAHGSGRLDADIYRWGKGRGSKFQRESRVERQ